MIDFLLTVGYWFLWIAVAPTIINIGLVAFAYWIGADRHILNGSYDDLLWILYVPMSWVGTVLIILTTITGFIETYKYDHFGGKEKEEAREREWQEKVARNRERNRRHMERLAEEERPYRENFAREQEEIADYLERTK